MKNNDLALLAVKLLGVYALVQAVFRVGELSFVFYPIAKLPLGAVFASVLPVALAAAIGVFLLVKAHWIASRLVHSPEASAETDSREFQSAVFAVIGVVLIVTALPMLTRIGMNYALRSSDTGVSPWATRSAAIEAVALIVQSGIGVVLFFGARGLSSIWHRMRSTDYPR